MTRGCGNYSNPSCRVFRWRLIIKNTPPPDLAAPPVAIVLLAGVVVLPSFGRLEVNMLVDVERAPYPSAASRLSAASSNTRVQPLIRPYLLSTTHYYRSNPPPPQWDGILVVARLEKHIGRAEREILAHVAYYFFKNPSVHDFPDSSESHRSHCRPS
jgi:hypothetical protein